MSVTFNMSGLTKKLKKLSSLTEDVIEPAYDFFVTNTPIKTGNARNNTTLKKKSIEADYSYAKKLDNGYSKQSPKGMTKPTEKYITKLVKDYIKSIGK